MSLALEYADEYEITALESYFKRPIVVYDTNGALRRPLIDANFALESLGWSVNAFTAPMFLLYSPEPTEHYDVLVLHSILPTAVVDK